MEACCHHQHGFVAVTAAPDGRLSRGTRVAGGAWMRIEYSVVKERGVKHRLGDNFYCITIAHDMQVISGAKIVDA